MIKHKILKFLLLTIGGFLTFLLARPPLTALAVLGEAKESVTNDQQKLSGTKETEVHQFKINRLDIGFAGGECATRLHKR